MPKTRVEAFSDGVFAIAITLLVLTVAQPSTYSDLAHELANQWPSLAAYIVSFAVIGIMWINHHSVFMHLQHVDRGLLYLNLLLLMTVAFLPYPTGILGQALAKGQGLEPPPSCMASSWRSTPAPGVRCGCTPRGTAGCYEVTFRRPSGRPRRCSSRSAYSST